MLCVLEVQIHTPMVITALTVRIQKRPTYESARKPQKRVTRYDVPMKYEITLAASGTVRCWFPTR